MARGAEGRRGPSGVVLRPPELGDAVAEQSPVRARLALVRIADAAGARPLLVADLDVRLHVDVAADDARLAHAVEHGRELLRRRPREVRRLGINRVRVAEERVVGAPRERQQLEPLDLLLVELRADELRTLVVEPA